MRIYHESSHIGLFYSLDIRKTTYAPVGAVLPSICEDAGADIVSFGMAERQTRIIARRLAAGEPASAITDVPGTCFMTDFEHLPAKYVECAGFAKVSSDKLAYAKATRIQMDNQDPVTGQIVVQKQRSGYLVQNPPAKPLNRLELDAVYALPYTRRYHPSYEALGGVPAIKEVEFSIIQNRGCFGGCNFCAITMHQGRRVTSRSADSIVQEGERIATDPDFKGYIHDVGGPTANFRFPACEKQLTKGTCPNRALLKLSSRSLKQTILMVTHDEKAALEADRILVMEDGRIVSDRKRG